MSDRTWGPLGRRRPYFLVGAILSSLALIAMPNCSTLWMAAGLLWILDASINVSMEPFRAFVADKLPESQRATGFAHAKLLDRHRRGDRRHAALHPEKLVPRQQRRWCRPRNSSQCEGFLLCRGGGVFWCSVVDDFLDERISARKSGRVPPEKNADRRPPLILPVKFFPHCARCPARCAGLRWCSFFTWLALFCMWIYFSPTVGGKVFGGAALGVRDESISKQLDSPDGRIFLAESATIVSAYDARKNEMAQNAPTRPWHYGLLQMFGLKACRTGSGRTHHASRTCGAD